MFIDRHKHLNIVDNRNNIFTRIKDLKFYMLKFEEDNKIKSKVYLFDCTVEGNNGQPIIIIIYDKYTISANNGN